MKSEEIGRAILILKDICRFWRTPVVTVVAGGENRPYKVLVSCIISLRTKDEVTALASSRLFSVADTPLKMVGLSSEEIASMIYPAGFYRNKGIQIRELSERLLSDFGGVVPDDIDRLLTFKGVGRKTANLVVTLGYGKPGICVDTHVHRICNRWGYVATKTADETEKALRAKLPPEYWIEINDLLVSFGQNHCLPISPKCSSCRLSELCDRRGVKKMR